MYSQLKKIYKSVNKYTTMDTIITKQDPKTIVTINGRIDTTNAKDFETAIKPLLVGLNRIIEVDCTNLSYISSSGLRVFLTMQKSMMANKGKLTLKNMNDGILEVFKMTGFASIFTIE